METATIIADDNLVLVKLDGNPLFKWIIEARKPNYVDSGEQQIIEVSGRGVLAMLGWAVVYPEEMGTPVSRPAVFRYREHGVKNADIGSAGKRWTGWRNRRLGG